MKARWFAGLALIFLVACGGGTPPPAAGSAVLPDTTKVLDDVALSALSGVSPAGRLTFDAVSPVLAGVEVGDVLIIGVSDLTPQGALRAVEAIVAQGGSRVVLDTRPALMEQAFRDLELRLDTVLTPSGPAQQQNGITFPFELSASDGGGEIALRGSLALAPTFDLDLDLDIAAFRLEELTLAFGADETLLATVTAQGEVDFDESLTLGVIPFTPIILTLPTPAGPVPVVLTPQVVVEAGMRGSVRGDVEASVTQRAGFSTGLGYRDGAFTGFADSDSEFDVDQPVYGAGASVRAEAGPRLEVLLYGAVGPFASASAFVELGASIEGTPPCVRGVVNAGLGARAGVDLLADFETVLLDKSFPLASFDSCDTSPGAPRPAVTWSRSYGRVGSPGERAGAVLEASDGTFLVVGGSDLFGPVTGANAALWAMRLDALGNVLWQRAYGGFAATYARAVAEIPGGFAIAGPRGVVAIDTGGNLLWARNLEGEGFLEIASMAVAGDGGLVLAGRYGNTPQAWIVKLAADGGVLWSRRYGGSGFQRVRPTAAGGYVAVGGSDSNNGDIFLVELDGGGNPLWTRVLDNRYDSSGGEVAGNPLLSGTDWGLDVVERPGGGYLVVGVSYGAFPIPEPGPAGYYAPWFVEVGPDGEIAEGGSTVHRAPADANYGAAYAAMLRPNGNALVLGQRADEAGDLLVNEDILVIQNGAYTVLGGPGNDSVYAGVLGRGAGMPLAPTADGGAIVAATSTSFAGREQVWLVKLSRTANIAFPYLGSVAGESFDNEDSLSQSISPPVTGAAVTVVAVTAEVEATPVETVLLAP